MLEDNLPYNVFPSYDTAHQDSKKSYSQLSVTEFLNLKCSKIIKEKILFSEDNLKLNF